MLFFCTEVGAYLGTLIEITKTCFKINLNYLFTENTLCVGYCHINNIKKSPSFHGIYLDINAKQLRKCILSFYMHCMTLQFFKSPRITCQKHSYKRNMKRYMQDLWFCGACKKFGSHQCHPYNEKEAELKTIFQLLILDQPENQRYRKNYCLPSWNKKQADISQHSRKEAQKQKTPQESELG